MEKLTLDEYRARIEQDVCRWCGTGLPETVQHYAHPGGLSVVGLVGLQWLYIECARCDYQWALWKLGVKKVVDSR